LECIYICVYLISVFLILEICFSKTRSTGAYVPKALFIIIVLF
jgi:hypothetical protein